jgi:hypothetical protein
MMLVLALTLLLPAAVRGEEGRMPPLTGFELEASNGYSFSAVAGAPPEGEKGWIGLYLARGRRTLVTYGAPATVSRTTIEADLGKLGRILVTRVPTGRMKTVRGGCKPGSTKRVEVERYEGTIEFHGEEGFAEVSATSAPLAYPSLCIGVEATGGSPEKGLPGARLDVEKHRREKYRLEFDAIQRRPGARTAVSVEVEEQRGEMQIHRATWTWAGAGALSYDRRLRNATVRPPAPFAGHGSFHSNARGANRWTGNLTVDLPGRSDVPVTGRGFWADLERPRR